MPRPDASQHADKILESLRQIHWAARQVISGNLEPPKLDRDKLQRLQASVRKQAEEAKVLQRRWADDPAGGALRAELAELLLYFDEAASKIGQQLAEVQRARSRSRRQKER
jgi:hypothetical protein